MASPTHAHANEQRERSKNATQEQVEKLKQAHKLRTYPQSSSPDPLAFLN